MPDTPLPVSRWFMQCFCFPAYEPVSTNPTHTSLHSARRPDVRLCPTGLRRLSALRTLFPDPSCTSFVRHPRFACIVPILHLYHSIFVLTPHRLYPLLTLDIIPNAFSVRCFGPVAHEWRKTPTARAVQSVGGLREPVLAMRSSAPGGAPAPGDTEPSGGGRATQKVAVLRARLLNSSTACVCSSLHPPRDLLLLYARARCPPKITTTSSRTRARAATTRRRVRVRGRAASAHALNSLGSLSRRPAAGPGRVLPSAASAGVPAGPAAGLPPAAGRVLPAAAAAADGLRVRARSNVVCWLLLTVFCSQQPQQSGGAGGGAAACCAGTHFVPFPVVDPC
jgi:hypothetical protein